MTVNEVVTGLLAILTASLVGSFPTACVITRLGSGKADSGRNLIDELLRRNRRGSSASFGAKLVGREGQERRA